MKIKKVIRDIVTQRSTIFGANSTIMVIVFIGILGILNLLTVRHHKRFDLTGEGSFTLSPQTLSILEGLQKEIKITAFYPEFSPDKVMAKDIFDTYRYYNEKIRHEFIDPDKEPAVARRYGINQYGTVVVESGIKEAKIKNLNEEELTTSIIRVTREEKKDIYFIEGHGEHSINDRERTGYSHARESLEKEGYEVKKIFLIQEGRIPEDAQVAVIAGPQRPFVSQELEVVESFLKRGGQLFILLDPEFDGGLQELLGRWGIILQDDIIIDPLSRLFGGAFNIPIVNAYYQHEIIKEFNLTTFFPLSRSISFNKEREEEILFQPVVQTGSNSWAERDPQTEKMIFEPEKDEKSPTLAASVSYRDNNKETGERSQRARLVIFGDSDFASNSYFNSLGNGDLFLNSIGWLAEEKELLSIRPKEIKRDTLILTKSQGDLLFNIPVVILPGIVFCIGIFIWRKRRRL